MSDLKELAAKLLKSRPRVDLIRPVPNTDEKIAWQTLFEFIEGFAEDQTILKRNSLESDPEDWLDAVEAELFPRDPTARKVIAQCRGTLRNS